MCIRDSLWVEGGGQGAPGERVGFEHTNAFAVASTHCCLSCRLLSVIPRRAREVSHRPQRRVRLRRVLRRPRRRSRCVRPGSREAH
eukprot:1109465-Alexandrium_andersonii.AAC.1